MSKLFKNGFIYLVLMLLIFSSFSIGSASAAEVVDYEEGVTNLNNTLENSAVVGSVLMKPEIGWKRYDDRNPKITIGNPKDHYYFSNRTFYLGSMSLFPKENNTVSFVFNGTKFRIISAIFHTRSTNIEVSIDGQVVDSFSQNINSLNQNKGQRISYEKNDLSPGTHVVVLKNLVNGPNKDMEIDAIDVDGVLLAENEIPNTTSITLDRNVLELSENRHDRLTATILPENKNKKIIWSSSDESIATVDQDGNVRAIKEGVITITAHVENTNLTADCIVTVKKLGGTESKSITLDRNVLELLEGNQDKLIATVTPDTAKVIWTSSDESIATVDQNGNVTALHEGEAIITAKIENTDIAANSTVIVKKPINDSSNAILSITLVNGITKEYDVTNKVLNDYLKWFDSAQGTSTFKFSKTISPYKKVTEYIVHDKIASFEVREY